MRKTNKQKKSLKKFIHSYHKNYYKMKFNNKNYYKKKFHKLKFKNKNHYKKKLKNLYINKLKFNNLPKYNLNKMIFNNLLQKKLQNLKKKLKNL